MEEALRAHYAAMLECDDFTKHGGDEEDSHWRADALLMAVLETVAEHSHPNEAALLRGIASAFDDLSKWYA